MSRASTSLELSEFFNDDDSEGHRLVEFIQKRRGGLKKQQCLLMNYEPQRLSLNVQLEKINCSKDGSCCKSDEKALDNKDETEKKNSIQQETLHRGSLARGIFEIRKEPSEPISPIPPASTQNPLRTEIPQPLEPQLPCVPVCPTPQSLPTTCPCPLLLNPLSPRRIDSRFPSTRKSGGASPSDRLRRYSLKRLTKLSRGRRTLLDEFESTTGDANFDPPVFSTPLSQPQSAKPPTALNSSQAPETENVKPCPPAKSSVINKSCCSHTDTLIKSLQRKDEELKNYMESIIDNTIRNMQCTSKENNKSKTDKTSTNTYLQSIKSPLKLTNTLVKGNVSGQVILTLDKSSDSRQSKLLNSQSQHSQSKLLETQERNLLSFQNQYCDAPESYRGSNILEISRSDKPQQEKSLPNPQTIDFQLPNATQQRNISIVFPTQDVEIPETQDQSAIRTNSLVIQSDRDVPLVVIPINRTCNEKNPCSGPAIVSKSNVNKSTLAAQPIQQTAEINENQCKQLTEDNLKLTDIFTDEEDETHTSRTIENNSQAPLNLAQNGNKLRIKRLRKRSFCQRRIKIDNSPLPCSETDTETPAQIYSNRGISKIKHVPLNRAPGIPLNGEQFAKELARMSNYEILDLRKRFSMGQVFALSGRRSRRSQEEAVKKKQQLDNQIDKEIIRRNIGEITDKQKSLNDVADIDGECNFNEHIPVPDEFRDPLPTKEDVRNNSRESSLIDERPSERVSFKNCKSKRSNRDKLKQMPEILKQYLEVSKLISRKKKNIKSNKSKRSLYTQEQYKSDEDNTSTDNVLVSRYFSRRIGSIAHVPSPKTTDCYTAVKILSPPPPKTFDSITAVKIISPPPPLSITLQKSTTINYQQTTKSELEEILHNTDGIEKFTATPPAGFESDSVASTNNNNSQSATNSALETVDKNTETTFNLNTNPNANYEDHLFKIPDRPPKKNRKQKVDKIPTNGALESTPSSQQSAYYSTDLIDGTLRRSKRGHVPLKNPAPIFQLLFQQTLNRRLECYEKQKQKERKKLRQITKMNREYKKKNTAESLLSDKSTKSANAGRKPKEIAIVPRNDTFISCVRQDAEILNKKKGAKTNESKIIRKRKKDCEEIMRPHDNFESSRLILNTPPVEHLNIVFDELRNTVSILNTPPQIPPSSLKVKPFKIRVARLKPLAQPTDYCDTVSSTSTIISKNSNYELISWLKSITDADCSTTYNAEIFKEMRISSASSMSFTQLQGVEYAFYDTDDKASLGYLRFKPRQRKSKKKAKRFHLHFITLVGNFRITANDKERRIGVGDMVAIEKSVYYDIENITNDIGILMVIKK